MSGGHAISARLDDGDFCMLGCVVDAAGVIVIRRVTEAAVSMKAVCSNCTGLAQLGSFKIQVTVELTKLVVVME
jgi:hypothetical protein